MSDQELVACDECDAHYKLQKVEKNLTIMTIFHDDNCPELAKHQAKGKKA